MPNLKKNPLVKLALSRHNTVSGRARTLQSAKKEALDTLGQPEISTLDPKGRVLRQLRIQSGIDPSELATQACMSLSQLYELEQGESYRFYSDSLRRQAGRRVARLLGADWDNIEQQAHTIASVSSNVVPLQRPSPASIDAALMSDELDEARQVQPTVEIYATKPPAPLTKSSTWTAVITLVLVTAAGAGAAYAFVEYSPYRLYWPW